MKFNNIILATAAALTLSACGQVEPGHVGIKVNQYGSSAGVDSKPLGVGTYFTPIGTKIIEYPIFTQTYTYTSSLNEGKSVNEEFTFNDKNGLNMAADIGVSYYVDSDKAPILYSKFRQRGEDLVSNQLRNEIRNDLNDLASSYSVEEIYGPKKQELLDRVQERVTSHFKPYGFNVEKLFWAGTVRLPAQVHAQINQRISNEQAALAAEANVATAKANADAKIAAARGESESNALLAQTLQAHPELVRLKAIERWNGELPTYVGGNAPIPFIGVDK